MKKIRILLLGLIIILTGCNNNLDEEFYNTEIGEEINELFINTTSVTINCHYSKSQYIESNTYIKQENNKLEIFDKSKSPKTLNIYCSNVKNIQINSKYAAIHFYGSNFENINIKYNYGNCSIYDSTLSNLNITSVYSHNVFERNIINNMKFIAEHTSINITDNSFSSLNISSNYGKIEILQSTLHMLEMTIRNCTSLISLDGNQGYFFTIATKNLNIDFETISYDTTYIYKNAENLVKISGENASVDIRRYF